jgi:hypothetical protein
MKAGGIHNADKKIVHEMCPDAFAGDFGQITTAGEGRGVHVVLKLSW